MGFNCGIVGLPNVGKSTLFNAITSGGADASNYPFCTIDPNVGIVPIPDPRLDGLVDIYRPAERVPSVIEFVDIAGLVRGAGGGEGLGNQFLSHIRDVDAIAHVVRCFDDPNIVHVDGSIDPRRDIEVVEAELIFKDLETVERKLSEAGKRAKSGEKKSRAEAEFHARVRDHLMGGRLVRYFSVRSAEEGLWLRDCHLLTNKPVMYVCNVNEKDVAEGNDYVRSVRDVAANEGARVVSISAAVEAEVAFIPLRTGSEGIRAHKGHTRRVRSSDSHNLLHGGTQRGACLDGPPWHRSTGGCRRNTLGFREGVHPG